MNTKTKKEIFHEKYNPGIYMPFYEIPDNVVSELNEIVKQYSNLDIYVDIVDDPKVNAFADKVGSTYFIGINAGAVIMFDFFSKKISSNPEILKEFGQSEEETNVDKIDIPTLQDVRVLQDLDICPISESRSILQQLIFSQSVLNILFHELGHILHGHVDLLESNGVGFIQEYSAHTPCKNPMIGLDRQTMEVDADFFAAIETMKETFNNFYHGDRRYQDLMNNTFGAFKLWSFIRMLTWRILDNNYKGPGLLLRTHPPTGVRYQFSIVSVLDLVRSRKLNESEFVAAYINGSNAADNALRTIVLKDPIYEPLPADLSFVQDYLGRLLFCHWDNLRKKLVNKAHYQLREPNIWDNSEDSLRIQEDYKNVIERIRSNNKP